MRLGFVKPHTIYGKLVAWFTWSRFSHVFIEDFERIFESHPSEGVRELHRRAVPYKNVVYVDVPYNGDVIRHMRSQKGRGYDWGAILGFALRRDWQMENRWFCSEIIAWAYEKAGKKIIHRKKNRVTPQDIFEAAHYIRE